jgi:hypothetical protein
MRLFFLIIGGLSPLSHEIWQMDYNNSFNTRSLGFINFHMGFALDVPVAHGGNGATLRCARRLRLEGPELGRSGGQEAQTERRIGQWQTGDEPRK